MVKYEQSAVNRCEENYLNRVIQSTHWSWNFGKKQFILLCYILYVFRFLVNKVWKAREYIAYKFYNHTWVCLMYLRTLH